MGFTVPEINNLDIFTNGDQFDYVIDIFMPEVTFLADHDAVAIEFNLVNGKNDITIVDTGRFEKTAGVDLRYDHAFCFFLFQELIEVVGIFL